MSDLMRSVIDSILPDGSIWKPSPGGDFDKMLDGSAENWETIRAFLTDLANIRNPKKTTFLVDLENEFGLFANASQTEAQRRETLTPLVYNRSSSGSVDALQNALDNAGYTVQVHENSPAVDPDLFLDQFFQMVAGGGTAFAGNEEAFAGRIGGSILVNGDIFTTRKAFTSGAATLNAYAGTGFSAGEYTDLIREEVIYPIPDDPNSWPMIFFVGGAATFGGGGELTSIALANVPAVQEQDFKRLILKFKPVHPWAGLVIDFV